MYHRHPTYQILKSSLITIKVPDTAPHFFRNRPISPLKVEAIRLAVSSSMLNRLRKANNMD